MQCRPPTDSITVNQTGPPKRCQIIREPTKIPERMKAAILSFCSQGSTFRLCKTKTPTVRPISAPNPWPARETLLQYCLSVSSLSQRITCKQDKIFFLNFLSSQSFPKVRSWLKKCFSVLHKFWFSKFSLLFQLILLWNESNSSDSFTNSVTTNLRIFPS